MKILLTSVGTRGDMEPFLALGELLKEKGHTIVCLFPEQFRGIAEDAGFEFASLGKEFIELLDSPAGRIAMGGGAFGFKKIMAYIKLIKLQKDIHKKMVLQQEKIVEELKPDRIVHNGKTIYPIIWGLSHPNQRVFVSPVPYLHYVKDHAHVAFNKDFGPFLNKLTYSLANFGLVSTISSSVKWLKTSQKISTRAIKKALFDNKVLYTISPSLFNRPDYWGENLQVLGYHERKKTTNWSPSKALNDFLATHKKVVLVTFGSMINSNPPEKTKVLLEVLQQQNIPAIINTASGGLIQPKIFNSENILFVDSIPYDWIFPKLYGVIHHGGSGTTHTAIKYGCVSLIIPHIIDQYVWNSIISKKELGPLGVDVSKISVKKLTPIIKEFYLNPTYKTKAVAVGQKMHQEDFIDDVCSMILS